MLLIKYRDAWFNKMPERHQALWWIPVDHVPVVEEGKEKLSYIQKNGVSKVAFSFAKHFESSE
jgi:hypothetical protein